MRSFIRVAIPLLIAAATPATIYAIRLFEQDSFYGGDLKFAFGYWPLVFIFVLFPTVILGLPVYFFVKHFGLITWWMSLLCGLLIGVAADAMFFGRSGMPVANGAIGSFSGFVAWLTW